uniref:FTH domain-containing protein n=1 Tax=Panagrellus redivivus TaxID=6233 RepID=A0A7E4WDC1_PANRE
MDSILQLQDHQLKRLKFVVRDNQFTDTKAADIIAFLNAQKRGFKLLFETEFPLAEKESLQNFKKELCEQLPHLTSMEFVTKFVGVEKPTYVRINGIIWYLAT